MFSCWELLVVCPDMLPLVTLVSWDSPAKINCNFKLKKALEQLIQEGQNSQQLGWKIKTEEQQQQWRW